MLVIQDLTKRFNGQPVLEGFDLTVPANGFTVLIGPSGCGKSTLFDLLMGIVPLDRGRLTWEGEEVGDLRRLAAYMQQRDLLLPWLDLSRNAALPAELGGVPPLQRTEAVRELFRVLKLEGFETYLPARAGLVRPDGGAGPDSAKMTAVRLECRVRRHPVHTRLYAYHQATKY